MADAARGPWASDVTAVVESRSTEEETEDIFSLVTWGVLGLAPEDSTESYRLLPPEDGVSPVRGVSTGHVLVGVPDGGRAGARVRLTTEGQVLARDPGGQPVAVTVRRTHDMTWVPGDAGRPWLLDGWTTDRLVGEPEPDAR